MKNVNLGILGIRFKNNIIVLVILVVMGKVVNWVVIVLLKLLVFFEWVIKILEVVDINKVGIWLIRLLLIDNIV